MSERSAHPRRIDVTPLIFALGTSIQFPAGGSVGEIVGFQRRFNAATVRSIELEGGHTYLLTDDIVFFGFPALPDSEAKVRAEGIYQYLIQETPRWRCLSVSTWGVERDREIHRNILENLEHPELPQMLLGRVCFLPFGSGPLQSRAKAGV